MDRVRSPMHTMYVPRKIPSFERLPCADLASMFLATKTRGKPRSAAYRSDPYPIFRDSTTLQTPAPRYSSARSHPIQLVPNNYPPQDTLAQVHHPLANSPIAIAPSMLDHNLSTSHRMIRPTVHRPFFPVNSLYEAEADSGRSGTVIDHSFNGRNLSAPAYTPRLTHDNYAFQNATFTATTEGAASSQDSFAHVQPPANDSIAISPGILGLDAFTTKQESTVPPMAHDLPLTPIGHRGHIALPMRRHKAIEDDFFQPEMSSGASREHAADDPQSVPIQFHENVCRVAHYLRHVNSKHWNCDWLAFSPFRLWVIANVFHVSPPAGCVSATNTTAGGMSENLFPVPDGEPYCC